MKKDKYDVTIRTRTNQMMDTQWGRITEHEWMTREAARMRAKGKAVSVRENEDGTTSIVRDE